jgi:hypothetical protein
VQDCVDRAVAIWRNAQVLHESPAWQGQPAARAIAEELASDWPEADSDLVGVLADDHAIVVGYALLTLELMNSATLHNLPAELLERRSKVTLVDGSFKTSMDLGGLARRVQKRAQSRVASPSAP